MTVEQIPLDLGARAAFGREDFFVSACNADAVAWLDRWPAWPAPALVLTGPQGAGKTHLAHVFQQKTQGAALVWDDIDAKLAATHDYHLEQDIFHAWQRSAETGQPLLLTAQLPPAGWRLRLEDLRSRIQTAPVAVLGAPDDGLMAVVLTKMFADRQLAVPPEVVAYVIRRIERSFAALGRAVADIDRAALAQKRAVTIPLVRELLGG